jgi:hypothetical protein
MAKRKMVTKGVEPSTLALLAPRSNQLTVVMLVNVEEKEVLNERTLSDRIVVP